MVTAAVGDAKARKGRRVAHALWAAIGVFVSVLLAFGRGHPPPIVFLPLVIVVWVVGHFVVWGVDWLVAKGQRRASENEAERKSWPVGVRLALIGTGIVGVVGLFQIVVSGYRLRMYPFHDAALWTIMMVIWSIHGACFVGLLLRRRWSRLLSLILMLAWALLLGAAIAEHLVRRDRADITELLIAGGIMVFLFVFGLHFATSTRVRSFLNN